MESDIKFWDRQFPANDERRAIALTDPKVKAALYAASPRERTVSGDDLIALEKLTAEQHGLDVLETSRLLEDFWLERDRASGYSNG